MQGAAGRGFFLFSLFSAFFFFSLFLQIPVRRAIGANVDQTFGSHAHCQEDEKKIGDHRGAGSDVGGARWKGERGRDGERVGGGLVSRPFSGPAFRAGKAERERGSRTRSEKEKPTNEAPETEDEKKEKKKKRRKENMAQTTLGTR